MSRPVGPPEADDLRLCGERDVEREKERDTEKEREREPERGRAEEKREITVIDVDAPATARASPEQLETAYIL